MARYRKLASLFLPLQLLLACAGPSGSGDHSEEEPVTVSVASPSPILATNAFYYYADVDAAWDF
jgi:hypothetical protein